MKCGKEGIDSIAFIEHALIGLDIYAAKHWPTHVQLQGDMFGDDHLGTLLMQFLGSLDESGLAYRHWHSMIRVMGSVNRELLEISNRLDPSSSAILGVCFFGFHRTLIDWLNFGHLNILQRNTADETLLHLVMQGKYKSYTWDTKEALSSSYDAIAQLLLRSGADVNAHSESYVFPLVLAVSKGDNWMTQLLLDSGADVNVNARSWINATALTVAAEGGHDKTVQLLLNAGADVNIRNGHYGSALIAATIGGYNKIVQLLLNAGADLNIQGGHYGSALAAAALRGNEKIVQLLLSKGANVNLQGGKYGSPLQTAAARGHTATMRLLLEHGADAKSSGYHDSAFTWANARRDEEMKKLLLEWGS